MDELNIEGLGDGDVAGFGSHGNGYGSEGGAVLGNGHGYGVGDGGGVRDGVGVGDGHDHGYAYEEGDVIPTEAPWTN